MDIAIYLAIIILTILFLWHAAQGALYVPTHQAKVEKMAELAGARPGMKTLDLGSGDGRIVIAMARAGADAVGYEVNPILYLWSRYKIKKLGLEARAKIYFKNFWRADFSQFDVITVFGINYIMGRLERKLNKEIKAGAKVISYAFPLPTWKISQKDGAILVYDKI